MNDLLISILERLQKPAYKILLRQGTTDDPCASKFGGTPYLEEEELWPLCAKCAAQLTFICQLDVRDCPKADLPSNTFGLLSFFYCWHCCPWESAHPGWHLKNYVSPSPRLAKQIESTPARPQNWFRKLLGGKSEETAVCAVSSVLFDSVPMLDDFEDALTPSESTELGPIDIDAYYDLYEKITGSSDDYSTQIGGYPEWIQGPLPLVCVQCASKLQLLLQVGSEQEANIMFGDAGAVYFMYCPEHPDVIKMELQCF